MKLFLFKNRSETGSWQANDENQKPVIFTPGEEKPCTEFFNKFPKYLLNLGECNAEGVLKKEVESPKVQNEETKDAPVATEVSEEDAVDAPEAVEVVLEDKAETPVEEFQVVEAKEEEPKKTRRGRKSKA